MAVFLPKIYTRFNFKNYKKRFIMKKLLPLIIAIFAFGRVAGQAIPDGSFDGWNTSKNWIDPEFYGTSNDQDINKYPGFTANVTQLPPWETGQGYAVQLKTVAFNGDTLPGYITNSINDPDSGKGGVPFSGQPTGIEVWYNYTSSTVKSDTGGMMVVFKKSGSIIGSYLCHLPVTNISYPLQPFTFTPVLPTAPDSVIFAATSSINLLEGKNGFAGSTLAISEVEFTSGTAQPSDLNWDFDPWVGDTAFSPQGWTATYPGTKRTTDSYNGQPYALELTTVIYGDNNNGDSTNTSVATTGIITNSNSGIVGGEPYTLTKDTLEFYYKYTPAITNPTDSGNVSLDFKSGTNINHEGMSLGAASSYTLVKDTFNLGSFVPDSVIVSFLSSHIPHSKTSNVPLEDVGSTLKVDDVQFASQPLAGIKPVLLANNSILVYPNPASSQLTISSAQSAINAVRLDNILGQTLIVKNYADGVAGLKENIDVSNLPSGIYFITITSGNTTSTGKILVNR
jgi:hypothetical protein